MDLVEAVKAYERAVYKLNLNKDTLKKKKEDFDRENIDLNSFVVAGKKEVEELIEEIKKLGKEEFEKTGNKKLFGGVGIQERKSIVYDKAKALEFAKEKDMFLSLDSKAFEAAAKSLNLDFVKEEKEIKVTIPKAIKL